MYGTGTTGAPWDPDELRRRADILREQSLVPSFAFSANAATKDDLSAAVARIDTQMLALLGYVQRVHALASKALKRKRKPARKSRGRR
jgi:hypothetical protein